MNLSVPKQPKEETREAQVQTKWVLFYKDSSNTFINDLAKRASRSSTHNAILKSKLTYTIGDGLLITRKDGKEYKGEIDEKFNNVNALGESLIDVFKKVAYDYILTGNAYYNLVRTASGYNIYHTDATIVRLGLADERGIISKSYLSRYWDLIKNNTSINSDTPVKEIDYYSPFNVNSKDFLVHVKNYSPENYYYGIPDYMGCLEWVDIEYKTQKFNLDLFENGFFPSALIQMYGDVPEGFETAKEYIEYFVSKFTGEGNGSKIIAQLLDSNTQAANVQLFDNIKDGHFKLLDELAAQRIISAHRWYPELSGILIPGKLGSDDSKEKDERVINTVIKEYQKAILSKFNNIIMPLLELKDYVIDFARINPTTFAPQIKPELALTIDEYRAAIGYEPLEDISKLMSNLKPNNGNPDNKFY